MEKYADLKNRCIAIGSLPFDNVDEAFSVIKQYCSDIPFCPQLSNYSRNEDMLYQFLESMPAVCIDNNKIIVSDSFEQSFNKFLEDFDSILKNLKNSNLDKYKISSDYCVGFDKFVEYVKEIKPQYAKTQITGPFTLSVNIFDDNNIQACFNESYLDCIIKTLALKALWQIEEIKKVSFDTTPIIFIDEPTISQLEISKYKDVSKEVVLNGIKFISDLIKSHGGISAIHCCGDCNWSDLLNLGFDIINFDAYTYSNEMALYVDELHNFLKNNGKIVWGIVPTLNMNDLEMVNLSTLLVKLDEAKQVLIKNGIDEKLIDDNLLISPSCGCATLSVELTKKTFKLANDLSEKLKG